MQHYFLFFLLFVLVACSKTAQVDRLNEQGFRELFRQDKETAQKEGIYQRFGMDGVLLEEATYLHDTLDGTRILFYRSGDTLLTESYRMGVFHGPFIAFYENGVRELTGVYQENVMSGEWRRYYSSGKLMEIVTFANNEENGPFTEYYENGNLKASGNYLDGDKEHGLLLLYDERGTLIRKMNCDRGMCTTIWKTEE